MTSSNSVKVRFQVILDDETGGYATISPDRCYPPFRLQPKLGYSLLQENWREAFLTWEETVSASEVTKVLRKETIWVIKCWAYDPWTLRYREEAVSKDTVISYYKGQCIIIAISGEAKTNMAKIEVEEVPSCEGKAKFEKSDIFDNHIVSISHRPVEGANIATFDVDGCFIDVRLRECYDGQIGERIVTRFSWRDEVLKGKAIPYYYVLLNNWSGRINTGESPSEFNDGEDYGAFTSESSWIFQFLERLGARVLERFKEQEHLSPLLAILFRAWMNANYH